MEKSFKLPKDAGGETAAALPEERHMTPDAETDNAAENAPSREERFNALIRGEFKDLFDKCVEEAVEAKSAETSKKNIAEKAARRYEKWLEEAHAAREAYPEFDLSRELKNEQFCELLRCGVPVKSSYELIHRDDLMKNYAKQLEESITKRILSGTLRPKEAAIAANGGTVIKSDTARMSRSARQEIIRRVQRGEKISF